MQLPEVRVAIAHENRRTQRVIAKDIHVGWELNDSIRGIDVDTISSLAVTFLHQTILIQNPLF